jgi:hypothetical protein
VTQQPAGLGPDKVAELEKKLADAAAEVARVQAQLAQAQTGQPGQAGQAGTPPPPVGQPLSTTPPPATGAAPGTTIPPVPYGGTGSHTITINGQPIEPGSGNFLQVLQQLSKAGAGAAAPVVVVNGQQVSGGQPVDIAAYLTPEVTQKLHDTLTRLGLDQGVGALLGHPPVPAPPANPTTVAPLAEPPRRGPFTYRLATFDLNVWELFTLVVGAIAGGALWFTVDMAAPIALIAACVVIAVLRARKYVRRIGMLKWGKVATVTNSDETSRGTYYSGTTVQNMVMRQARGWDVTSRLYSGPVSNTSIAYTLDGQNGTVELKGLEYANGVVLADSRKPGRAMVVSQFPYSVKPDETGNYTGTLTAWRWGGVIATLVVEATLVYVTVVAVLDTWFS